MIKNNEFIKIKQLNQEKLQEIVIFFKDDKSNKDVKNDCIKSILCHYKYIVDMKCRSYIGKFDEDLFSEVIILLIDRLDKYSPKKGTTFNQYVSRKINFVMIHYINKHYFFKDKMTRRQIEKFTKIKNKIKNNTATTIEINYFNEQSSYLDDERIEIDLVTNDDSGLLNESEIRGLIKKQLSPDEFLIFNMKNNGYTFFEISKHTNTTKQAVSQRHKVILNKLKNNEELKEYYNGYNL